MEISVVYILSQFFVVVNYFLLIMSYQLKSRKSILIANFISLIANAISLALLGGYTGMCMSFIAIIRNIIFLIDEKKNGVSSKITKKDNYILFFIFFLTILCALITYNGFWSLMPVFATLIYTYSVWQKNTKIYKILGLPVGVFSLTYNIYVCSFLGIILESLLTMSAIIGFFREQKLKNI